MEFKRWDRLVCKENHWYLNKGDRAVINQVNKNTYEIGTDKGYYYTVNKHEAEKLFYLDSKLLKVLY